MDDLISRQAAIYGADKIIERDTSGNNDVVKAMAAWKEWIKGLPPAQPEIIRCKDCRFNTYSKKCLNPDSFFLVPADDFYCGYAERKENR